MKENYKKLKLYTKNQTTIWKIPDYNSKIWFIKKGLGGKEYTNQTNGCACNHPTYEGSLYEVHDFGENPRPNIFNPDWWYKLYNRYGGHYTEESRKLAENAIGKFPDLVEQLKSNKIVSWEEQQEKELEYFEYIKKNNLFISANDLKEMFVSELKKLVSDDFFDVDVIVPFNQTDKHGLEIESSHEAWVYVRLYYKYHDKMYASMGLDAEQTSYTEGVITWENCD